MDVRRSPLAPSLVCGPNPAETRAKPTNNGPKPAKYQNIRFRAYISAVGADIGQIWRMKPYFRPDLALAGYLKAVWRDFLGWAFEVWPAPGGLESLQKCGGLRPPHFLRPSRAPGAGQTSKNAPTQIRPDCLQVRSFWRGLVRLQATSGE